MPCLLGRDAVVLAADAPLPIDRPFTAAEATRLGVPPLRHVWWIGLLRPLVRGVFVATQVPDSLRLRVQAVQLVMPPHAVVVDRLAAAWVHGVDALPRPQSTRCPISTSSAQRQPRAPTRRGQRDPCSREADVEVIDGLPLTTRLRTACDLGRVLWRYDALGALDGFIRLGLDQGELLAEVERFKGFRGVRQLRELAPLGDAGAESQPESALAAALARRGPAAAADPDLGRTTMTERPGSASMSDERMCATERSTSGSSGTARTRPRTIRTASLADREAFMGDGCVHQGRCLRSRAGGLLDAPARLRPRRGSHAREGSDVHRPRR